MLDYSGLLIQGFALGLAAAASPGPFQAYLINQALTNGFRRSAPVAFAPLIADIPIVIISVLLLDQLSPRFLRLINIAGGVFVLYMAYSLWRSWSLSSSLFRRNDNTRDKLGSGNASDTGLIAEDSPPEAQPPTRWSSLGRGILMNLLSPGPYTFWLLVSGPILLSALRHSTGMGLAFLLGFYGALTGGFLGIAALFHLARRLGPRAVRALSLVSIVILAVFGGILLKRGIWR